MTDRLFERATREKFEFKFKGSLTVQDLWDLKLTELNEIYKGLKREISVNSEESLLEEKPAGVELLESKKKLVEYIAAVKKNEQKERENALYRKQEVEKLERLLANKENEELNNLSKEEILARLNELKA